MLTKLMFVAFLPLVDSANSLPEGPPLPAVLGPRARRHAIASDVASALRGDTVLQAAARAPIAEALLSPGTPRLGNSPCVQQNMHYLCTRNIQFFYIQCAVFHSLRPETGLPQPAAS